MNLSILYRGLLSSCNYGCRYCPFSKRFESNERLEQDRAALSRFIQWISGQTQHRWKILFTPWGEALVRNWYRTALVELSHVPTIDSVAIQTNLSGGLKWLTRSRMDRVSLWATYHPTETTSEAFLRQVRTVLDQGARICVGAVGITEHLDEIERLRVSLPRDVYLWINAQRPRPRPYTIDEIDRFQAIDPSFKMTSERQPSFGRFCLAGETSFTVDSRGDIRRCHFVDHVIGNCYQTDWEQNLFPRECPKQFCNCFLGQAQLLSRELAPFFGTNLLERQAILETI